jgi:hypothetical protein
MKLRSAIFASFLLLAPAAANPAEAQVKLKTRTSIGVSDATAVFGESVTLSATVKLVTGGSPVGIVKFKDVTAGALLGSAPLDAKGVATLVVTSLKPGIHDIRGTFNGSADQASSSGRARVVVRREYVVLGADQGSLVIVLDARTHDEVFRFDAFPGFTGGVSVAATDMTDDFIPGIVVGAGTGGGSVVSVFDGSTGAPLRSFQAFPGFTGMVTVAAADVSADGRADLIVAASANGYVKVFDGVTGATIRSFFAFQGVTGAVSIAAADVNGDRAADLIVGAPLNGHVKVFDGSTTVLLKSFFAYPGFAGGVNVAAGDLDGDGVPEILTGAASTATHVKAFDASSLALRASFLAYAGSSFGVRVSAADVNGDGRDDILTVPAAPLAYVKAFDGPSLALLASFLLFDPPAGAGMFIAGSLWIQ